ncbi:MAG: FAD-dependent oxidoreductase [Armatimonadota bacterium]
MTTAPPNVSATHDMRRRALPLEEGWDVVVLGGGPAGCTAAAAAAREGARTLLIEASGMLGGSATSALVPAWCPFSDKEKVIYRGLAETVLERCKAGQPHVAPKDVDWVPIDAERLKRVYDDLLAESGADVRFHTMLADVETDSDGMVSAIVLCSKSGLTALRAHTYIDCTGDGDLCAWAGAQFHKGDSTGDLMPATHCFILTNVDDYAFRTKYRSGNRLHAGNPESPLYRIMESGRYPLIPDAHFCCNTIGPGTVGFNAGHLWNVDNTDPISVSRALTQGRRMASQYRDALAEFCPDAFGNAFLVMTGSVVGIRETRRVVGDYVLTLDDYIARRSFDDEICRNAYFIDIHHALADVEKDNAERREGLKHTLRYGPGESHGIPYRCLIPTGLQNVLVAGRSISCERIVQGSVRVMPVCLAMGEAAGTAAAMAARNGEGRVRSVAPAALRNRLWEAGAYLPGADTVPAEESLVLQNV